jgi:hypothetical protein
VATFRIHRAGPRMALGIPPMSREGSQSVPDISLLHAMYRLQCALSMEPLRRELAFDHTCDAKEPSRQKHQRTRLWHDRTQVPGAVPIAVSPPVIGEVQ